MVTRSSAVSVMVGREREAAALRSMLDGVASPPRRGRTTVALVSGEAGIGKSRLVDDLLAAASPTVTASLVGTGRPGSSTTPFGLVREMTASHVLGWARLPGPLQRFARPLAFLLGALSPAGAERPGPGFEADDLLFAGFALVRHIVGEGPAVVVMEDLHWADAESLALFSRLATGVPALLIGTYRPEEVARNAALAAVLDELDRAHRAQRLAIEPLGVRDIAEMVASLTEAPATDQVAHAVWQRTGGNPFFVEELLATVDHRWATSDDAAAALLAAPLPWSSTEALLRRLGGLDAPAPDVLAAASILPEPFPYHVVAEVSGTSEADLLPILRDLVAARVLVEAEPDRFVFRHALMREAVLSRLLAWQRRSMHARALAHLQERGTAMSAELAWHADGAADPDAAARYAAAAAAEALSGGSPRQARLLAARGLAHRSTLELHRVAARAAVQLGEVADAADHAHHWAAAAAAAGDCSEQSVALCQVAFASWAQGARGDAWDALAAAEVAAEATADPGSLGWVAAVRAQLHFVSGDLAAALRSADRALEIATRTGDRRLRGHALVTKAAALTDLHADSHPQLVPDAVDLLAEARRVSEDAGDIHNLVRALNNATMPGQGVATLEQVPELIAEGHRVVEQYGAERFGAKLASIEAWLRIVTGRFADARAALARPVQQRAPIDLLFSVSLCAFLDAESGDTGAALDLLEQHRGSLDAMPDGEPHIDFALAEAAAAAASEDAALGLAALDRACRAVPHVPAGSAATWWDIAACAAESGIAPETLADRRRRDAPAVRRRNAAAAAHVDGLIALGAGDVAAAVAALREAADDEPGTRPTALVSSAARQLAELLATSGDLPGARASAALAVELLADWPGWRLDAAVALRRRLGDGERPAHELLTRREQDVAALVARGCSNREIAAELFISPKTASTHVSNILAKTGLKRRSQIASWAVQSGLAPSDPPPPAGGAPRTANEASAGGPGRTTRRP